MDNYQSKESKFKASCWLSLATIPVIVTLSIIECVGESLGAIGQSSEEIFRGNRLPVIHFPDDNNG